MDSTVKICGDEVVKQYKLGFVANLFWFSIQSKVQMQKSDCFAALLIMCITFDLIIYYNS